jgi:hypothetical protein
VTPALHHDGTLHLVQYWGSRGYTYAEVVDPTPTYAYPRDWMGLKEVLVQERNLELFCVAWEDRGRRITRRFYAPSDFGDDVMWHLYANSELKQAVIGGLL